VWVCGCVGVGVSVWVCGCQPDQAQHGVRACAGS